MVIPYLAVPTYDGRVDMRSADAAYSLRRAYPNHGFGRETCSLLAYGFNRLYADALNRRKTHGFTHFVMLHADVAPLDSTEGAWATRLFALMQKYDLGVLSVACMIKNNTGDTSTGLDVDGEVTRLGPAGIGDVLTSRDLPNLLMNTGCMAIDITKPWAEKLFFHIKDGIVKDKDGRFTAVVHPEDWELSRLLRKLRVPYGVTTLIDTQHFGVGVWSTHAAIRMQMEAAAETTTTS